MSLIQSPLKTGLSLSMNSNENEFSLSISTQSSGGFSPLCGLKSFTINFKNGRLDYFFQLKSLPGLVACFLTKLIYGSCCAEPSLLLTVTWLRGGGFSALSMVEQPPLHYADLGLVIVLFFPHSEQISL